MGKTRFMSLLFLVWSLAFFLLPDFRQGLEGPAFMWSLETNPGLAMRAGVLKRGLLEKFARAAEQQRDAQTLAFVALHSFDERESARLADQAVTLDPDLTWIYYSLVSRFRGSPDVDRWIARLEAWDHDNGLPYALDGEQISYRRRDSWPGLAQWEALEQETAWRAAMAKAFAAPRYDSYATRRFDLERAWLRRHHLAKPAVVLLSIWSYPVPNLLNVRQYAKLLISKFGHEAEQKGRLQEAVSNYWVVAHFGEKMQLEAPTLIEQLVGANLQDEAYERLIPLLRRTGRAEEAQTVQYAHRQFHQRLDALRGKAPLDQSSNYYWAALMVDLFAGLVIAFGLITAAIIIYLIAKHWVRREKTGRLYVFLIAAGNYVPILLFLACLGLYLNYYPYAENFRHYMVAKGEIHDFEPLFYNVFPNFLGPPGHLALPLENPFGRYVWYALCGLVLIIALSYYFRRKSPSIRTTGART